ncbi:short-chain dehydrogenase [Jeotgalibacillus alimentarius]|uniref:Short-chain dehydrogenase n=1 Tax=Jeotgalibacillus alimentarius TaxID=135826 RepID=A0A0C2VP90_9BACL|nr:SDR family oxidoreductase [Jeotgalibacillus alimentarius]KIL50717.1 short-chain dehydrogenase [Jeotgalibacillus alimentarius]
MIELNGKTAIVTGGASGIGLATVEAFLKKRMNVVLADFNEEGGSAAAERLGSEKVTFIHVDTGNEDSVKSMIEYTVKHFGQVDVLVNNAGIGALAETHELTAEDYHKVISVNQDGVFYGSKYAIREMMKTGGGSIVNTSSILGFVGQPGAFAYNASKGAVNTLTKSLALEYADKKIRVNSVNPGYVESGMVNKEALGDYYDGLVAKHPVGRLGVPEEIAHAIVFLCENEFVTGINLLVDGGYTAQ